MLELNNISFCADAEKEILKDINMTVKDGEFLVVTGPNGGGKSTLAKVIAGIETPSNGKIMLDGKDITGESITARAKAGVSFAFQQPVRFKGITVRDMVQMAAQKPLSDQQISSYLWSVGLCAKEYLDREVSAELSGGEMKRVEIAGVMAKQTKLAIFDEPEAGIDLWSFKNLIDIFQKMREEMEGSIIVISHQERILEIADEIMVLSGGEITARGTRQEILPQLLKAEGDCQFCAKKERGCGE